MISAGEKFVVSAHARPDADTIGSALALARGLRQIGKDVIVLSQDGVPETCLYLPDTTTVLAATSRRGFDVGIVCDADGVDRVGTAREALESAKHIMIVDHHVWEEAKGCPPHPVEADQAEPPRCLRIVDTSAAATAEVVYELLLELGVSIDEEIASQLMAAIVGDTGSFRFTNVTPRTFEISARLAEAGASPAVAAREIYENRSMVNARLLGVALTAAQVEDGGRIVHSRITLADLTRLGATDADTDSIVNQLRGIKGTEVGILFREIATDEIRVSLRSKGNVNVQKAAAAFGGGGHPSASGCTLETSLAEAENAVLAEVRAWMGS